MVYSSASAVTLKKLDTINSSAARIATGAFCTSPIYSLLSEANLVPLNYRRMQLTLSYALTSAASPFNPTKKILFSNKFIDLLDRKSKLPKPINIRILQILKKLNMTLADTLPCEEFKTPPWLLKTPRQITFDHSSKKNENQDLLKSLFLESASRYPDYIKIYTDGSKTKHGTGCGIVTPVGDRRWKLPDVFTIFSCEAYAALEALKYIDEVENKDNKYVIYTDSMSTLAALRTFNSGNPIMKQIVETYNEILSNNKAAEILFGWVPSHLGIRGNERADQIAKEAANQQCQSLSVPAFHKDILVSLLKVIKNNWNIAWENSRATYMHCVRNDIFERSPAFLFNRKQQSVLTRIRIGHTNFSHVHLIKKEDCPMCINCNLRNSIHHIISSCPVYESERRHFEVNEDSKELTRTFNSCGKLLKFLKHVNLFHLI
ncbi:uncharacterized protein LOC122403361 [Colletes gigas]|uniref:uncharacterized protein LOC122403361 n=1 Tax=Colletes gigas TaxID=935657 RepID=UPI001C9B8750|nr:uncharacterized protein LOC122403361 [Colletes gigas]